MTGKDTGEGVKNDKLKQIALPPKFGATPTEEEDDDIEEEVDNHRAT